MGHCLRRRKQTNGALNELFVTVGQGVGTNELAGTFAKIVFKP